MQSHSCVEASVSEGDQAIRPIAWVTYTGHRYARELDCPEIGDALPFRRELAGLKND